MFNMIRLRSTIMLLLIFYIIVTGQNIYAATITADSCERSAVQTAINSANDGDTIVVPAGNCTWTSAIRMPSRSWVLQGAGIDNTTISAAMNSLLIIPDMDGKTWEITGFTFVGPAGSENEAYLIRTSSYISANRCDSFQFHHNKMKDCKAGQTAGCLRLGGPCYGVIYNNIFKSTSGAYKNAIDINQPDDDSWSSDLDLGGHDAVYIEENYFEIAPNARYLADGSDHNWLFIDSTSAGRYVVRYNVFKNGYVASHGTCYNSTMRGTVKMEVYKNWIFHEKGQNCGGSECDLWEQIKVLSGTGVLASNVTQGAIGAINRWIAFSNNRSGGDCNFATVCDGTNPLDGNQPGQYGAYCYDQPGVGPNQVSMPWYIWENKYSTTVTTPEADCENDPKACYEEAFADETNTALTSIVLDGSRFSTYHFKKDRNYFMSQHPTWTQYNYPHPLRGGAYVKVPSNVEIKK